MLKRDFAGEHLVRDNEPSLLNRIGEGEYNNNIHISIDKWTINTFGER